GVRGRRGGGGAGVVRGGVYGGGGGGGVAAPPPLAPSPLSLPAPGRGGTQPGPCRGRCLPGRNGAETRPPPYCPHLFVRVPPLPAGGRERGEGARGGGDRPRPPRHPLP